MNKSQINNLPKFSKLVINIKRSLFDIERLLELRLRIPEEAILVRAAPITRWNE